MLNIFDKLLSTTATVISSNLDFFFFSFLQGGGVGGLSYQVRCFSHELLGWLSPHRGDGDNPSDLLSFQDCRWEILHFLQDSEKKCNAGLTCRVVIKFSPAWYLVHHTSSSHKVVPLLHALWKSEVRGQTPRWLSLFGHWLPPALSPWWGPAASTRTKKNPT